MFEPRNSSGESHLDSLGALLMKVVFVGSSGVGKTNVLTRFVYDEFNLTSQPTKGSEFAQVHYSTSDSGPLPNGGTGLSAPLSSSGTTSSRSISTSFIPPPSPSYNFHLWDAQGQQRPRAACPAYYRDAVGVLLVYDVTNFDSYLDCEEIWAAEIREFAPPNATVFLLGNKCDLANLREVPYEDATLFAAAHNMRFMEVSALDYTNIDEIFTELSRAIDPAASHRLDSSRLSTSRPPDEGEDEFVLVDEPVYQQRGTKQTLFAPPVKQFCVHVYFDSKDPLSLQSAEELHAQIKQQYPILPIFNLHRKPTGPHSLPMFEIHLLNRQDFGALLPWLCLRRGQHSILVRPQTGDSSLDYTTHAIWLGTPIPLDLEKLDQRSSIDSQATTTTPEISVSS